MSPRCHIVIVAALALAAQPVIAQMYKWVDDRGVTHFSDAPPAGASAQALKVQPASSGANAAPPANQLKKLKEELGQSELRRHREEQAEQKAASEQAAREAKCRYYTGKVKTYEEADEIGGLDENGKHYVLDDNQRRAAINEATQLRDSYCAPEDRRF